MKVLWLFRSQLLWIQQRHSFCTFLQRCSPYIENHTRFGGLWMGCKRKKRQRAFSLEFSTKINNQVDTPMSATEQLANLSEKQKEQLEQLKVEVEIMRAYGHRLPESITADMWLELLEPSSKSYFRKKLTFWSKKEHYRKTREAKKQARQEKHVELKARNREKFDKEGLPNTYHQYIRESTMLKHYENNLYYAVMNGPTIIYDMAFEERMNPMEVSLLGSQIRHVYSINKLHPEPVHLHFCSLRKTSQQYREICKNLVNLDTTPITVSEEGYLDIYPTNKLVYLSPDASTELQKYNDNDVYIIGGYVDRKKIEPITWIKAKQDGIRSARLPLERYVSWAQGSKCLTLDQMLAILLDLRITGDWRQAFRHLPQRKLKRKT